MGSFLSLILLHVLLHVFIVSVQSHSLQILYVFQVSLRFNGQIAYIDYSYIDNYAAFGFCDAEEILTESGTTFYWPETIGTKTATFTCPLGEGSTVDRICGDGGVWDQFNEIGCGESISAQLNHLIDLFLNVKLNISTHIIYKDYSYLRIAIAYH